MKHYLLTLFCFLCIAIFKANAKITYSNISPTRIVWVSESVGKYLIITDNLLKYFTGQFSLSVTYFTTMHSTDT